MWTTDELIEIRDIAESAYSSKKGSLLWRSSNLDLAKAADRLLTITERICKGEITALDENEFPKPLHPNED